MAASSSSSDPWGGTGWVSVTAEDGRIYFWNQETDETTWTQPETKFSAYDANRAEEEAIWTAASGPFVQADYYPGSIHDQRSQRLSPDKTQAFEGSPSYRAGSGESYRFRSYRAYNRPLTWGETMSTTVEATARVTASPFTSFWSCCSRCMSDTIDKLDIDGELKREELRERQREEAIAKEKQTNWRMRAHGAMRLM